MDSIIESLFSEIRSHIRLSDRAESSLTVMRQRGTFIEHSAQFADLKEIRDEAQANAEKIRKAITILKEVQ